VAKELFISIKTVETHVSSVLRKLQLSNRHQLTPLGKPTVDSCSFCHCWNPPQAGSSPRSRADCGPYRRPHHRQCRSGRAMAVRSIVG
jgi:hypothetical protein